MAYIEGLDGSGVTSVDTLSVKGIVGRIYFDYNNKKSILEPEFLTQNFITSLFNSLSNVQEDWNGIKNKAISYADRIDNIVSTALNVLPPIIKYVSDFRESIMETATTTGNLNIRLSNSTSSEKLGTIPSNTEITILDQEKDWSKIKYIDPLTNKEIIGYVSNKYIKVNNNLKPKEDLTNLFQQTKSNTNKNESKSLITDGIVNTSGGNLNVRSGPNGSLVDTIKDGTSIKIGASKDGWTEISYIENGKQKTGYVSNKYIEKTNNVSISSQQTHTSNINNNISNSQVTKYVNTNSNLNVRVSPGVNNAIKTKLQPNTEVKVISTEGDWSLIQIGNDPNNTGYVNNNYLSDTEKL